MPEIDCFITVGGRDSYGQGAVWLSQSILYHHPDADVYVGIPSSEEQSVPLPDGVESIYIEPPMSNYLVSTQAGILQWVEENRDYETIAVLDPDTLVVNRIQLPKTDADLYLKPADLIFYRELATNEFWENIYDILNIPPPSYRVNVTVTGRSCWPFYEAGVYVISGTDIGGKLIQYTRDIYNKIGGSYFSEQYALSALATELDTCTLTERHNFPLNLRLWAPYNTKIFHYKYARCLLRGYGHWETLDRVGFTAKANEDYPGADRYKTQLLDLRNMLFHRVRWKLLGDYGWGRFQDGP